MPEERFMLEQPGTTIYQAFFELLPATVEAHRNKDEEKLRRYYGFAAWCLNQKQKDLWNAAGVAFYEHLADQEETFREMPRWVSMDVFLEVRGLFEWRLGEDKLKELYNMFGYKPNAKKKSK